MIFIDDDMEVPPAVLDAHTRLHDRAPLAVVLGWIKAPAGSLMPLFERFHARYLDDLAGDAPAADGPFRESTCGPEIFPCGDPNT